MRPLYDVLRAGNPGDLGNVRLRGKTRPNIGDPEPAYPGLKIGTWTTGDSAATPDHIVPVAEIINMKGFTKAASTPVPGGAVHPPARRPDRGVNGLPGCEGAFLT